MHLLGLMQLCCSVTVFILSMSALVLRYYFLDVIISTAAIIVVIRAFIYSINLATQGDWTLIC